ncbi:MAG: DUF4124 domain-containing protein [Gammaproteobacteria bacterium]|nr:DUF4124 domain-containing protein [Gammaproteobacteria bacterium]
MSKQIDFRHSVGRWVTALACGAPAWCGNPCDVAPIQGERAASAHGGRSGGRAMPMLLSVLGMLLILIPVMSASVSAASIYKWRLPDGTYEYSDVPSDPNAQRVDLPQVQTYSTPSREPSREDTLRRQLENPSEAPQESRSTYESLRIVQPADGETFRDQGGRVPVQVNVTPTLVPGDKVEILVDGQVAAQGLSASVVVERGSHVVKAQIRSARGSVVIQSQAIAIQMHRTTVAN